MPNAGTFSNTTAAGIRSLTSVTTGRNELHTFKVLPSRWAVARTSGWLGRYRPLNRDHERQAQTGETMIYLAMIRLMLARLGRDM